MTGRKQEKFAVFLRADAFGATFLGGFDHRDLVRRQPNSRDRPRVGLGNPELQGRHEGRREVERGAG